jgi:hypothetical protein
MICRKSVQLYAGGTESLAPLTAEKRSIIRSNRGPTFFFFSEVTLVLLCNRTGDGETGDVYADTRL